MSLPPTEAFEVLPAELTADVLRLFVFVVLHSAVEPWQHHLDLVTNPVVPVCAVHVALLAVVVFDRAVFVTLHVLFGLKSHAAGIVSALPFQLLAGVLVVHNDGLNV